MKEEKRGQGFEESRVQVKGAKEGFKIRGFEDSSGRL